MHSVSIPFTKLQEFFKKNFPYTSLICSTTDGIVDGISYLAPDVVLSE